MHNAALSDQEAQERIAQSNKVHVALLMGPKNTHQLALDVGISMEDVARAINLLSRQRMVESFWSEEKKTKLHTLTDAGRMFAPAPAKPDFKSSDCDPRVSPKNTPRFVGTRHFEGLPGKFPVDQQGNMILDPAKPRGMIYFAIDRAMTATEIAQKVGLADQFVWNQMTDLVKMKLVIFETVGKSRIYRQNPEFKAVAAVAESPPPPAAPPPKPKLVEALPADAKKVEVAASDKPIDLTPAIQMLLKTYSATDIALALFAEVDAQMQELREFKIKTESLFSNLKLAEKK